MRPKRSDHYFQPSVPPSLRYGGTAAESGDLKARYQREKEMPIHAEAYEFWIKVLGVIGALAALTLTWRTHAERATFDMIDRMYAENVDGG